MALARYTFLPWLRRGAASAIADARDRASRADDRRAPRGQRRRDDRRADREDVPAHRAGRRHRHQPRSRRAHRAARLGHRLRAQLPRLRRFLRRGLPLAPHAGAADARASPDAVAHAAGAGRGRVRAQPLRRPAAAVDRASRRRIATACFPPRRSKLWAWAHVQIAGDVGGGDRARSRAACASRLGASPDSGVSRLISSAAPRARAPRTTRFRRPHLRRRAARPASG